MGWMRGIRGIWVNMETKLKWVNKGNKGNLGIKGDEGN